ncbi:MAG: hypothetical protein V4459_07610 [Pseudomonadota bacterium]
MSATKAGRAIAVSLAALATIGAAPAEPISMSIRAWGQQLAEWQIQPDGAVVSTVMDPATPGASSTYKLVTRRLPATRGRFATIANLLKPARPWAGKSLPCKTPMTDADSGVVHWNKAVSLSFYSGCTESETRAVLTPLYAANAQINLWTKDAPIAETRTVGPGQ